MDVIYDQYPICLYRLRPRYRDSLPCHALSVLLTWWVPIFLIISESVVIHHAIINIIMFSWIKARLRLHFGFSNTEAYGTLVLLLLMSVSVLIPLGFRWYTHRLPTIKHERDIAQLERTLAMLVARERPAIPTKLSPAKSLPVFDINMADEIQLSKVSGIGAVLATRIISFRSKLGGFIDPRQYQEVYGLQPEVVSALQQYAFIGTDFQPTQIDINVASTSILAAHPYLTSQQAQNIIQYRAQHGAFSTLEELHALFSMDEATLTKIRPYLCVSSPNSDAK